MALQDRPDYPTQPCPIPRHGWKWIPRNGWECSDCRFDPPKEAPVTTHHEWRVTGKRLDLGPAVDSRFRTEDDARTWAAKPPARYWTDGPHLHRRTVTVTEWEDAG